jgi:lipopolysaccharide/colanic/teichoic acid biosynthesis glycosyltransferase
MDLDYISGSSMLKDLDILLRTVPAVIRRTGAH